METFDVVVIGSGPGGYVSALRCAQLGMKTALIEKYSTLGGTCLNVGCIPSKALLQSSEIFHHASHKASDHGIKYSKLDFDLAQMMKRKEGIVVGLTKGIEGLFKKNKVTYVKGKATFLSSDKIQVIGQDKNIAEYSAKSFVISTGSVPVELKAMAPFDGDSIVSSTEALSFEKVPEHLVVIGAGVIGLEMGSVWMRLGSKVTVVEALTKVLPPLDKAVSNEMQKILEKQGMVFHVGTKL
jgi:dihydrolipoamide dehydrogenase